MKATYLGRTLLALGALLALRADGSDGTLVGDTYTSSTLPANNFGSATLINVGNGNTGLLQFDFSPSISGMVSSFPGGSPDVFIGKATLTVYVSKATVAGTLRAQALLSAWQEGTVTNATLPAQGGHVTDASVSAGAQFVNLDITNLVQGWMTSNNDVTSPNYVGGGNFGVSLTSPDGGVFVVDSKESTSTSHAALLTIEIASDFTGTLRKNLTLSAPGFTSLMSVHLTGTNTAGGRIFYMIRATDGGSQIATEEGVIQFNATANSITCTVQPNDKLHLGTVNSGCTPGFFNPGSQPGVSIFDNVTFSSPAPIVVHEIFFKIQNLSGAVVRLEP
jgi:hypothetical protein